MLKLSEYLGQFSDWLWRDRIEKIERPKRSLVWFLRILAVLRRDLSDGQLALHAMSLVYTTLLALVPLIAFSFSVLKGLGVHNRLEPLLFEQLAQLGPQGNDLGERIMGFVDNVRADVLGSVGLAILIYLIISLVQKIEASFNTVWRVQQPRSLRQRFSDYLSVILIGPLLIAVALGITASLQNSDLVQELLSVQPFGWLAVQFGKILPYLLVIATFAFIYVFIPNTKVRWHNAFLGGLIAGVLWQTVGWVFTNFVAGSGNYVAIYSSFAIVLTSMIWLYLSWLILLIGASVAYYAQNPQQVTRHRTRRLLSNQLREALALEIMYRVGRSFHAREPRWDMDRLSEELNVPGDILDTVTSRLEHHGLLLMTEPPEMGFVPGTDMESLSLDDILAAVRRDDPEQDHDSGRVRISQEVQDLVERLEGAGREALQDRSLRSMVIGRDTREKDGKAK
ncbi:MAG: YihY/virulence factor BrkB family protein [Gammaproteobacteria bacterium]|nr:YihY/virulence factor BrkB family protein [Gammaproteobacteria bacterium]